MNKAFIIDNDSVTVVEIVNYQNCNRDYYKLFTLSGKILICLGSNLRLYLNSDDYKNDQDIVRELFGKDMKIKYYEDRKEYKLKRYL